MKKLTLGLLASCCTLAVAATALAEPFPDGVVQGGYVQHWNLVSCPKVMSVIGTRVITDPGYDWTILSINFENINAPSSAIKFVGAGMENGVAKCFYKMGPRGWLGAPSIVLVDNHHFLGLLPYDNLAPNVMCPSATHCFFGPKHLIRR
jgi:hypothetical protein